MSDRELSAFRNANIGFVFQSFNLLGQLTALENAALPLVYRGVDRREMRRRGPWLRRGAPTARHRCCRPAPCGRRRPLAARPPGRVAFAQKSPGSKPSSLARRTASDRFRTPSLANSLRM